MIDFNKVLSRFFILLTLFSFSNGVSAKSASINNWVSRSVSLQELGLSQPVAFNQKQRVRHFYFPIAQNVPLKDAYIDFDATYLRQFASVDGLTILINGTPVDARSLSQGGVPTFLKLSGLDGRPLPADFASSASEEVHLAIPLQHLDPEAKFVDLSLSFNSLSSADRCTDITGRGNELMVAPNTRLRYRYDRSSVLDVRTFLTTLPRKPQILLPASSNASQYEAALRLLIGLRGLSLSPQLITLPKVGDMISSADLQLPEGWKGMEMFQSLSSAQQQQQAYPIQSDADIAAWLAVRLSAPEGLANLIMDPQGLRPVLVKSGEIWVQQGLITRLPSAALQALAWAKQSVSTEQANLRLVNWSDSQLLMLDAPDQNAAALLTGSFWAEIANGSDLGVTQVDNLAKEVTSHRLMIAQHLPVQYLQGAAHWEVPFAAKDLPNGERPNSIQLNIVSAHRKGDTPAVVSVFMNDFLLTAKELRDDGEITAVNAFVPLYTLKSNNVVRIEVYDTDKKDCSSSQPLPVQVLPSSYLGLGGASDVKEFFSLVPLLNNESQVVVPTAYLQHAQDTLQTVSLVLQGLAMPANGFKVEVLAANEFKVTGPFVSFDVIPKDQSSVVDTKLDRLVIRDKSRSVVFDSRGLGSLAVVQIVGSQGVLVSRVGKDGLNLHDPLELSTGNLAILDEQGVKITLNTNDPQQEFSLNESGRGIMYLMERYHLPFVFAIAVLIISLLVLFTRAALKERHRRMHRRSSDEHGAAS